jgi:DNA-binding transcriptional ArsR family regulator
MSAHQKSKSAFDLLMNRASDVFQALSHPLRLAICFTLSDNEKSVSQLCETLHQPQHSISQHLALLRRQKVVNARKQSRQVFYQISDPQVQKLLNCINSEILVAEAGETVSVSPPVPTGRIAADEAGRFSTVFRSAIPRAQHGKD